LLKDDGGPGDDPCGGAAAGSTCSKNSAPTRLKGALTVMLPDPRKRKRKRSR
jgi:hypothetical protein